MSSHFLDPWYWFYTLLGLVFWAIWYVMQLIPGETRFRLFESFGQWRFWPCFMAFTAGGASSAMLDVEPLVATGMGAAAYFLTGFNPKAGKNEPWLSKNA